MMDHEAVWRSLGITERAVLIIGALGLGTSIEKSLFTGGAAAADWNARALNGIREAVCSYLDDKPEILTLIACATAMPWLQRYLRESGTQLSAEHHDFRILPDSARSGTPETSETRLLAAIALCRLAAEGQQK